MSINDFIESNGIRVILQDMPTSVRGFVTDCLQDKPTIFINARMPREIQLTTLKHEIAHISQGDLWKQDYIEYA